MNKRNMVNVLGFVATVVGIGATLLTNYVDKKNMDERIEEKINEAFSKRDDES